MLFKHPEILYFLFLLVIPILVHLFQLRRFKKVFFTNVRFLKELSAQTRKSSTIKKWLLLATRLFLLACLITAFAQPYFKAKDHQNNNNTTYIVLDNSYSMQAKGQKGELLKRAVEDLLEHTPENQNFSLLTNTDNYWNTDIKSVQKELQNLKYSATPFELEQQIARINAHKSPFAKDIIVITDAVGLETSQTKNFKKEDNVYFILPEAENKNNTAIDSVFIQQTLDNFYEIGIQISSNHTDNEEISVSLFNHDKLTAKTLVALKNKNQIISFNIPKEDFNGYVTISDKGLPYDNTYYFTILKPQKNKVISIGDADKSPFLSRIFTKDEFEYTNVPLANLDYNSLEKQDVVVVNELKDIPQALQTTLKTIYNKGVNIVFIPNSESNLSVINAFLKNFGAFQFTKTVGLEKKVTKINFNHPLFSSVFEKKIDNFQYPNLKTSFDLKSATPAILSFEDQSVFLSSGSNGLSSVYIFAAAINKSNSNFQNSPLIVPTFYKMGQSNHNSNIHAIFIGDTQPIIVEAMLGKDEILTLKSKQEQFIPVQQPMNTKVKIKCNDNPKEAGNFGIYNDIKLIQNISFNYNRTEGNLELANSDAVKNYNTIEDVETVFNTLHSNRTDTQIWKWFVMLTLLFFIIEIFIQKFVK